MTIKNFHTSHQLTVDPASIKKRLQRRGMVYGLNDDLSQEAITTLKEWYLANGHQVKPPPPPPAKVNGQLPKSNFNQLERELQELKVRQLEERIRELETRPDPAPTTAIPKIDFKDPSNWWFIFWRRVAPNATLPMLGMAASYGVFSFAAQFSPTWVAVFEAAAFEMTYIGLAALEGLTKEQRERAKWVAIAAVVVSVIYNTLAALLHQAPEILTDLPLGFLWLVSFTHGAPLAILAYLVSDLLFHRNK